MTQLSRREIIALILELRKDDIPDEVENNIIELFEEMISDKNILDYVYWSNMTAEEIADKVLSEENSD